MFTIAVNRDFVAQHFLIGGDWGTENEEHSHHYRVELQLHGNRLDQQGFLVDILEIEQFLNAQINYYRDHTLNELPEFRGLNPSIEHFSRILCQAIAACIRVDNIYAITIKLWENEGCWASYRIEK
jgi:6-pyruvoyltetrahydropterin/6-carboxytetrahydropterin synthase